MRTWALLASCGLALLPPAAWGADFMGAESCKACHPEAYTAWKKSKHARAFDTLSANQKKDARCVTCHAPDLKGQEIAGVTCETCHGGGQYYSPDYVMKDPELSRLVGLNDPSEKQCRACHDASSPSLLPFDFVEKLKLIDHWTAERQRREQEEAAPAAKKRKKKAAHPASRRIREALAKAAVPRAAPR